MTEESTAKRAEGALTRGPSVRTFTKSRLFQRLSGIRVL